MRVVAALMAGAAAQQVGTNKPEVHLPMQLETCTKSGCTAEQKSVTMDGNWRWTHKVGQSSNCYTGHDWDKSVCDKDPKACAANCALDGVPSGDWNSPYGVKSDGKALTLDFVTQGQYGVNVGSRVYLLDNEETYMQFKLKNREFTFDVDVSNMPCGVNGALYFAQMPADGGIGGGNKAGAKFGTGYCDAQCPHDIKFINGEANILEWDDTTQFGKWGTCCGEMDIWEANKMSNAYTAHTCDVKELTRCEDPVSCGDNPDHRYDGHCDKDGCDFAPFRLGATDFFGEGSSFTIDSSKPMTVVTQFITSDNTDAGDLVEIRRKWVQNGKVIESPEVEVGGEKFSSLTSDFCTKAKGAFGDKDAFTKLGGLKAMGETLDRGMTLVMSLWDDKAANMLWLDSSYPPSKDPSAPGVKRGTCDPKGGAPADVESQFPNSNVIYSNLKVGAIGSTFGPGPSPGPSPPSPTPPSPSPSGCPGGTLSACMALCPTDPTAYKACVGECSTRCKSETLVI